MKKIALLCFCLAISAGLFAQGKPAKLATAQDSINYAFGMIMAANVKRQLDKDLNYEAYKMAFETTLKGEAPMLTQELAEKLFGEYSRSAQAKATALYKVDQKKFLEENKKRTGVTTTPSGLQYEVMQKGTGTESPKATDRVEVHYHGTLIDGTIFDSSVKRGTTSAFGLNQVIKGWTEGLQYMKIGDKFKFFIPSELAYGDQAQRTIKSGSTLIFEVELFKINP